MLRPWQARLAPTPLTSALLVLILTTAVHRQYAVAIGATGSAVGDIEGSLLVHANLQANAESSTQVCLPSPRVCHCLWTVMQGNRLNILRLKVGHRAFEFYRRGAVCTELCCWFVCLFTEDACMRSELQMCALLYHSLAWSGPGRSFHDINHAADRVVLGQHER
jgi:hypothetical protein